MKKLIQKRVLQIIATAAAVVVVITPVCLLAWDYAEPPLWWQKEAQENKKVILEYAEQYFPDAIIVEQVYQSANFNITSDSHDYIIFEQDGVRFSIWANNGKFLGENFVKSRANQYIERELLLPYWKKNSLSATFNTYIPGSYPPEDLSEYEDAVFVNINQTYIEEKNTPDEIDWFYDFYLYWQTTATLQQYWVTICYTADNNTSYHILFNQDSIFQDANDFYAAFERD
ncbi:MAG: hypothetical protein IJO91_10085 [Oscillospiraceae bacterium]|nr:hypothetical protein [Oscillospiraceae bacterium]